MTKPPDSGAGNTPKPPPPKLSTIELRDTELDITALDTTAQREMLAKLLRARATEPQRYPMSMGQQGLWHAFQRDPRSTAFNVFLPTRMRAPLDVRALQQAIEHVAARHACLHSVFSHRAGQLIQEVQPGLLPGFEIVDIPAASDLHVRTIVAAATMVPFDLVLGPLLRVQVYRVADDDWIVLAMAHHIVVDFWSLILILDELRAAYPSFAQQLTPNFAAAENHFARFVHEQQGLLASPRGNVLRDYWQDIVDSSTSVLDLPTDHLRPNVFENAASSTPISFPSNLIPRQVQLAKRCRATPFAVVQAALQVFLQRLTGQTRFMIGSPFSGRSKGEYERTVGFFINVLPLAADLEGDPTFEQLVIRTRDQLLGALEHEAYPLAQIVHDSRLPRDPARSPLFQVSCTFEKSQLRSEAGRASFLFPNQRQTWDFGGLPQESFFVPHPTCHYDLEFIFEQTDDSLRGMIVACRALFDEASLQLMAGNFSSLLQSLVDNNQRPVSQVAWNISQQHEKSNSRSRSRLTLADHRTSPNSGDSGYPSQVMTVDGMICAAAQENPDGVALQFEGRQIHYHQLCPLAGKIAQHIRAARASQKGSGSQQSSPAEPYILPIYTHSGPLAFIRMFAAHLSGCASAAIDASQPAGELDDFVDTPAYDHLRVDDHRSVKWQPRHSPSDAAYMVYTSGSTGRPKGVLIDHAAVCNTLQWRRRAVPLEHSDRVLMLLSHQFDGGLGIGWTTLTQGATLIWPDAMEHLDPERILSQIIRDRITVLPAVPSLLRVLVAHPLFAQCHSLRLVFAGGEALPADLPSRVRQVSRARFWNFYGPSEAAIEATACDVTDHSPRQPVPIGLPIDNTQIMVLDAYHRPVPDTVPGELAIAGAGLARGYWKGSELDQEATSQKFIWLDATADDLDSNDLDTAASSTNAPNTDDLRGRQRVYLTGDRGRRLHNGQFQFLGRMDHQVKLRGYRIELGEIESVLEAHPQVARAAIQLVNADTPQAQILGFVSLRPGSVAADDLSVGLRRHVSQRLPSYKVPTAIGILDQMPMTSSGKVDRRRLPQSLPGRLPEEAFIAPETPLEEFLATAWCAVLQLERVSVDCNFFDCGGSSLQAALLTTQLSQQLGVHVPTALLFDLADIARLALRLAQLHPDEMSVRFGLDCLAQQLSRVDALAAGALRADCPRDLHPLLAPLKLTGSRPPIFMIHPPGGIVVCYRELAQQLTPDQPLLALRSRGLHGAEPIAPTLTSMAADYLQIIRGYQSHGPYTLGGWSLGGLVAYEMAQQLLSAGDSLARLILLDTTIPAGATDRVPAREMENAGLEYGIELTLDELGELPAEEQLRFLWEHAQKLGVIDVDSPPEVVAGILQDLQQLFHHHVRLAREYHIEPLAGHVDLIRPIQVPVLPTGPAAQTVSEDRGWRYLAQSVAVHFISGHHHSMVQMPHVAQLARIVSELQ